jgi:hypothetical protein
LENASSLLSKSDNTARCFPHDFDWFTAFAWSIHSPRHLVRCLAHKRTEDVKSARGAYAVGASCPLGSMTTRHKVQCVKKLRHIHNNFRNTMGFHCRVTRSDDYAYWASRGLLTTKKKMSQIFGLSSGDPHLVSRYLLLRTSWSRSRIIKLPKWHHRGTVLVLQSTKTISKSHCLESADERNQYAIRYHLSKIISYEL